MEFSIILFNGVGNFYNLQKYEYKSYDTILINNSGELDNAFNNFNESIGYFTVVENDRSISGIKRYLRIETKNKRSIKVGYLDHISDEVRDLYGEYIDIISERVGLRYLISSFNELIEKGNIVETYEVWLRKMTENVEPDFTSALEQRISKFVNLYLTRIYERLYGKNIQLLKSHESEIAYKILETKFLQRIV